MQKRELLTKPLKNYPKFSSKCFVSDGGWGRDGREERGQRLSSKILLSVRKPVWRRSLMLINPLKWKTLTTIILHLQLTISTVYPVQISSHADCCITTVIMFNGRRIYGGVYTLFTIFFEFRLRSARYEKDFLPVLSKSSQASMVRILSFFPHKSKGVFFRHISHGN